LNLYYFFLVLLFTQTVYGEDAIETWNSVSLETQLFNQFEIGLEQGLRIKDGLSSFKQTFTELTVSYDAFDAIKIFIPVRYAIFDDKTKHRLSLGGSYRYNFKNLTCKYRLKLQRTSENSKSNEDLFRNKISIVYKMNKKIKPFISSEMVHLQDINKYNYDEYRLSLGLNLNLSKKKSLKIFYLYKLEDLTKSNQDRINVFGLAYNLKR